MKIIQPSHEILTPIAGETGRNMLRLLEQAGRVCYKSEGNITCDSHAVFVPKIANEFKHESCIEHVSVSVRLICDRGVSHEIVRHRLASYSQESTRYCNYSKDKFGKEITVIDPGFWETASPMWMQWKHGCENAEACYFALLEQGASAQQARAVLPNSLKTEMVMTANLREWRHIFGLRCSSKAHPQMQQLMRPLLGEFQLHLLELFADIASA